MRFDETRMRQMFFERAQDWIESFDVPHLQDESVKGSQISKLGSLCSVVGNRFFDEHVLAFGEESACNIVMSNGGRCHGSRVDHRDEIIEGFGSGSAEFARNGATPERLHVINRGKLSGRNFRVEPCMITSDMPNTNYANAQLFHWSPNAVNSESFRGQRSKL